MKLKIEIDLGNVAFEGDQLGQELERILFQLAEEAAVTNNIDRPTLYDSNGNKVGSALIFVEGDES